MQQQQQQKKKVTTKSTKNNPEKQQQTLIYNKKKKKNTYLKDLRFDDLRFKNLLRNFHLLLLCTVEVVVDNGVDVIDSKSSFKTIIDGLLSDLLKSDANDLINNAWKKDGSRKIN
jgi:hypothetical protein